MLIKSIYALISTLGFGVLFNIKGKNLIFASIGGALTWYIYLFVLNQTTSTLAALLLASVLAGIYSEILARILKAPVTIFSICAVIPLVPGSGMYYTMLASIQGDISKFLSTGLDTFASAGSIAVGILIASSIAKLLIVLQEANKSFHQ